MPHLFLDECIATFRSQKALAERAMVQLTDEQLRQPLHPEVNSIAVIVKHMSGNMISRWTDFLTTDGDKPNRDRDGEFIDTFTSRADIMTCWENGWSCLLNTLGALTDADGARMVTIRGESMTATRAILRQLDHYGYHVGQIVQTARILAGDRWQVLTIPRGGSKAFNERMTKASTNPRAPG